MNSIEQKTRVYCQKWFPSQESLSNYCMIKLLRMSCFAAVDNLDLEKGQHNDNYSQSLHFVLIKRLQLGRTWADLSRILLEYFSFIIKCCHTLRTAKNEEDTQRNKGHDDLGLFLTITHALWLWLKFTRTREKGRGATWESTWLAFFRKLCRGVRWS